MNLLRRSARRSACWLTFYHCCSGATDIVVVAVVVGLDWRRRRMAPVGCLTVGSARPVVCVRVPHRTQRERPVGEALAGPMFIDCQRRNADRHAGAHSVVDRGA